jgi:hypothetical protein
MDKQNLEAVTMGRGSSVPCLKEDHIFEYKMTLTVRHKRNTSDAMSY